MNQTATNPVIASGMIMQNQQSYDGNSAWFSVGPYNVDFGDTLILRMAEILGEGVDETDTDLTSRIYALLKELQDKQWDTHFEGSDYVELLGDASWYADLDEKSDYNWFGLELGVQIEGEKINLLPKRWYLFCCPS